MNAMKLALQKACLMSRIQYRSQLNELFILIDDHINYFSLNDSFDMVFFCLYLKSTTFQLIIIFSFLLSLV